MFRLLLEVKQGNVGGSHVICRNKLCNRKLTPANALSYLGLDPLLSIMLVTDFKKEKRKGSYLDLITLCRRIGAFQRFIARDGADSGSGPIRMPTPVKFRRKRWFVLWSFCHLISPIEQLQCLDVLIFWQLHNAERRRSFALVSRVQLSSLFLILYFYWPSMFTNTPSWCARRPGKT